MKWTRCLLIVAVLAVSSALAANAEQVIEAFRTPFGEVRGVAVNPTDSSVWVTSGGSIVHLAADASIIGQFDGFAGPSAIAVNATDGSYWFTEQSELVHCGADGTELLRLGGFSGPSSVSVNSADDSCWVGLFPLENAQLIHVAEDGSELLRVSGPAGDVSVNPSDGSCWVGAGLNVVHLAEDGTVLSQAAFLDGVSSVAVNPADGSCWASVDYTASGIGEVVHLGADGGELWRSVFPGPLWLVSVNEADGSCWVTGGGANWPVVSPYAAHLAADGTELVRVTDLGGSAGSGAADPTDSSFWVAAGGRLVHLAEDGTELWRGGGGYGWLALSADTPDASCWTLRGYEGEVVHLAAGGSKLWSGTVLPLVLGLSADSADSSCWVAGADNWQGDSPCIVHLAEDGRELLRKQMDEVVRTSTSPAAVNSSDGSCWLVSYPTGGGHSSLVHLAQDGSIVLHLDFTSDTQAISVNPADNTVWVVVGDQLRHLAENGTELLRVTAVGIGQPSAVAGDGSCWYVAVNYIYHVAANGSQLARIAAPPWPKISANGADGSCWVISGGPEVIHLGAHGEELWRGPAVGSGQTAYGAAISVNSADGSAWVQLTGGQLAHLVIPGWRVPRFYDVPSYFWAFEQVEACAEAGIVMGYTDGLYHPEYTVDRGTMAVYISRALAGGDGSIPDPPDTPSFSDVPTNHWAYKHIEYAVSQNVVKGYTDGTYLPSVTVDRGTMAVYVARAMVAPGGDGAVPDPVPPATFPDVPDSFWSYKQVEYCVSQSVVSGYDDGLYHPERVVTRDQMAVYIARAFGLS